DALPSGCVKRWGYSRFGCWIILWWVMGRLFPSPNAAGFSAEPTTRGSRVVGCRDCLVIGRIKRVEWRVKVACRGALCYKVQPLISLGQMTTGSFPVCPIDLSTGFEHTGFELTGV